MAGNAGHPFFGNQYTIGAYNGGYHYDWVSNSKVAEVVKKTTEEVADTFTSLASHIPSPSNSVMTVPGASKIMKNGKDVMIIVGVFIGATAIGTGAYYLYQHYKKKKSTNAESQTTEMIKVGSCRNCSKPLSGSDYVDENASDSGVAYIICKHCGEKNYAWYPTNDDNDENE